MACHLDDCAFDVDLLPLLVPPGESIGELDFDGSCNLLVSGGSQDLVERIDPTGNFLPPIFLPNTTMTLGIAYRASDDLVYISTDFPAQLWSALPSGETSFIMNVPSTLNALEVAPAGFGAYEDMLIAASHDGIVRAIDPLTGSIWDVGDIGALIHDLVFDPILGTLYLTDYDSGQILTMDATGMVDTFACGLDGPNGLAIDPFNTLFVATSSLPSSSSVTAIDIATGMHSVIAEPSFDSSQYGTGLRFDANGTLLMKTQWGEIDYLVP